MFKLACVAQNYAWGKVGAQSTVANLLGATESKPYAELWMGTHPNGPSKLENGQALREYLEKTPEALGAHEKGTLQFLFKVLSVNKALSIQSHPTKEKAKELHARDPKNYPDDNHKPEMAIALTDFELLCGFRQPHEIISNFKAHRELLDLVDEEQLGKIAEEHSAEHNKQGLREIFTEIWKAPVEKQKAVIDKVVQRLKQKRDRIALEDLMLRLDEEFPGGDIGVLAPLLLNYFTLKPDCIECMACSDNTIRAGLTPKYKDVDVLCSTLTYEMSPPPYFPSRKLADGIDEYAPPVPEFAVHRITKDAKVLPQLHSSSILIVVAGTSTLKSVSLPPMEVKRGDVVFVPANLPEAEANSSEDFLAFRAYTPIPSN
ncbi:mannose-6-phosphate isomerase [Aphelenchoides avenae]|nr:mannose-6-phosphate isomerase [Aphelenchus avenae]